MATLRKPLLFLLLLSISATQVTSHTPSQTIGGHSSEPGDSDLKHELDRLKSKISSLESTIDERSRELSKKDETIRDFEMAIQKKSESTSNSRARATEHVNQVHEKWLPHWLAIPMYHIESFMVSCWNDHVRPALDITIQKVLENKDQLKTWAALQIRNTIKHLISMMKDGLSKSIKFLASHLRSLPYKIIDVYDVSKNSLIPRLVYHWNDRGRPALDVTIQKALEKIDQLKSWAGPQILNVTTHLIPMMMDGFSKFIKFLASHLRSLPSKVMDIYDVCENSLMPHLVYHWNYRGRPALDITIQKVLEKIDQLKSWAGPQIRNVITHLIPMMMDGLSKFIKFLASHLRSLPSKVIDLYDVSKNSLMPHLVYHWNDRGRPALDITTQKVLEKIDQLKSWAGPQIRNVITHLIPMVEDGLSKFINYLEPSFWYLLSKTSDVYDASKNTLAQHLILTDDYIQEWKKFPETFINHIVMVVTVLIVFAIIRVVMIFGITRCVIRLLMVVIALMVFWAAINWVLKKSTELSPVYLALAWI